MQPADEHQKDRQTLLLKLLLEKPGNGKCVDCGAADPMWASYTLGVFICQSCSGLHRNITYISKVKSVLLDPWSEAEVQFMASMGNDQAKAKYEEKHVNETNLWRRAEASSRNDLIVICDRSDDSLLGRVLREQWIRARYERNEFVCVERQEAYSTGYREGSLWKRGRDNGQYLSRKFVLSERDGVLKYYNRPDAKEPKASVKVDSLNATFQPTKIGNAHGLQITFLSDNSTRNLFVYHADGKEMVDWFNAIRAARFHYLQVAFPRAPDTDLVPQLTRNYVKEGLMQKTGPKHTEGFKKRWFTLDDRRLMYFRDALDASARGELFLGSEADGYRAAAGLAPPGLAPVQGHHAWPFGITVVTPERTYLFACESQEEQRDWLAGFHRAIRRPMLPQEYAVEARFKHKS